MVLFAGACAMALLVFGLVKVGHALAGPATVPVKEGT
jgi:hypothetical protein